MGIYLRPNALEDALAALDRQPLTVLAGGTDFYPARVGRPLDDDILDITAIPALRGIAREGRHLRFGAATTWRDVIDAPLPPWCHGLQLAAREVGGAQIQNAGTIAGNLCNASPAADGVPNFLAMDAEVELVARAGVRRVPLAAFILGNRKTARRPDELVAAVLVPIPARPARGTFLKLGARRYLVISIVMVAAIVERDGDRIAAARIAVGACSAVAQRLPALEAALVGQPLMGQVIDPAHLQPLAPIDDVRGTAPYRLDAAATLVARALDELALA